MALPQPKPTYLNDFSGQISYLLLGGLPELLTLLLGRLPEIIDLPLQELPPCPELTLLRHFYLLPFAF